MSISTIGMLLITTNSAILVQGNLIALFGIIEFSKLN